MDIEQYFKCVKCNDYVEKSDIANIYATSDNFVCRDCEKESLLKK